MNTTIPTIENFMTAAGFSITEGWEYGWKCYGSRAYALDSDIVNQCTLSIIFDRETQEVYELAACDYEKDSAYRWINPAYVKKHRKEAKKRGVNHRTAWDDVDFFDVEVFTDVLGKGAAMRKGEPYDNRIAVPLTLSDEEIFLMMKLAHEADITLNQFAEKLLTEAIERSRGQ